MLSLLCVVWNGNAEPLRWRLVADEDFRCGCQPTGSGPEGIAPRRRLSPRRVRPAAAAAAPHLTPEGNPSFFRDLHLPPANLPASTSKAAPRPGTRQLRENQKESQTFNPWPALFWWFRPANLVAATGRWNPVGARSADSELLAVPWRESPEPGHNQEQICLPIDVEFSLRFFVFGLARDR